jgi:hypothetical protein
VILIKYYLGNGIKENEMRWDGHVAREVHTGFWWAIMKEGAHLEDRDVDGRTIFKQSFRK